MKRKIVKQGAATLMVSLPAKWAKKFELGKGDEISIEEEGDSLKISQEETLNKYKRAKIDVSGLTPLVNRVLIAYYVKGVDELEITFTKYDEVRDFQKRVIGELIGFEIFEQTQKSILIKSIAGSDIQEIDDLIKRIFFILNSMLDEFIIALDKKEDLSSIIDIDSNLNKFVNFCMRNLNKRGYKDFNKTPQVYEIVSSLEDIGDMVKKLAQRIEAGEKITRSHIETLRKIRKFLGLYEHLFFKFDKDLMVQLAKEYESIKKEIGRSLIDTLLSQISDGLIRMNNPLLVMMI